MSLSTNKIILAGAQANTPGAYFLTTTITAVNTGNGTVVPAGVYMMFPQANVTVIAAQSNTANATIIAANTGGTIISDGVNVWAKSSYSGGDTVTLIGSNGGQAVTGTYNS